MRISKEEKTKERKKMKRRFSQIIALLLVLSIGLLAGCSTPAGNSGGNASSSSSTSESKAASDYPKKDITLIVPFTAGGASDVQARILEKYFKDEFGVGMIFQYKEGAGGEVGFTALAQAQPDGYTIGTINMPHIVLQPLGRETDFDYKSFDYIGQVVDDPQILAVPADSDIKTMDQFIEKAKAGNLTIGTVGTLTGNYMCALDFMDKAGVKMEIVPFDGSADQIVALQGKHVDCIMGNLNDLSRDPSQYTMLGISSTERHDMLPDVPTFKEQGLDVESHITRLFATPAGVDPAILERLREGFKNICTNPDYIADMKESGQPESYMDGEELTKTIEEQNDYYKDLLEKHDLLKK